MNVGPVRHGVLLAAVGLLVCLSLVVTFGWHHRLYHALLYAVVAHRVTAGATTPDEQVRRLEEFVHLTVRHPDGTPVIDDTPADTLLRGIGFCDSAQMALVRLVRVLGIPAQVTMLRDAEGRSPHSVAEVSLDGTLRIVDAFFGLTPRAPSGAPATLADLSANPTWLGPSLADPVLYQNTAVLGPKASLTRADHVIGMVSRLSSLRPFHWIVNRLQDLYLLLPPPHYEGVYLGSEEAGTVLLENFNSDESQLWYRARNWHVFGRHAEAAQAYLELVQRFPSGRYADDALFRLGQLAATEAQQPGEARQWLMRLEDVYPESPWLEDAAYLRGLAALTEGDCLAARQALQEASQSSSTSAERARQQVAALRCG